jgi:carbon-monoxide dehydrogenase medium subunit
MWRDYILAQSLDHALDLLAQHRAEARIIAGGTDIVIELDRKVRPACALIDISRLPGLNEIRLDDAGWIHLGPLVTHNDVLASALCIERAFPLAIACRHVGAPQIRNRATIAGNLVTASPANDTIPPLMALDAVLTLRSAARGERRVPLTEFYAGVRKTAMQPDEMLVDIAFRALRPHERGTMIKLALRRAQAISVVNCAVILEIGDRRLATDTNSPISNLQSPVASARIALGAVAPTVIRAREAEQCLIGKSLDARVIEQCAALAQEAARPIDDIRAGAAYRRDMVGVIVRRALAQIAQGAEREAWGDAPALLWAEGQGSISPSPLRPSAPVRITVNGQEFEIRDADTREKTLLRLLREDCGLIGTKEGCSEGECGACTVLLDGKAVMACLVPALRAHNADIITIEGVAGLDPSHHDLLHPLQHAFIDAGAVQCGYCTPGFIMSGAALLREHPQPTDAQIKESISGNLCRCTGYYKIIEAFHTAARTAAHAQPEPEMEQ